MTDEEEELKIAIAISRENLMSFQKLGFETHWSWELQRYAYLLGKVKIRKVENESPEI